MISMGDEAVNGRNDRESHNWIEILSRFADGKIREVGRRSPSNNVQIPETLSTLSMSVGMINDPMAPWSLE